MFGFRAVGQLGVTPAGSFVLEIQQALPAHTMCRLPETGSSGELLLGPAEHKIRTFNHIVRGLENLFEREKDFPGLSHPSFSHLVNCILCNYFGPGRGRVENVSLSSVQKECETDTVPIEAGRGHLQLQLDSSSLHGIQSPVLALVDIRA